MGWRGCVGFDVDLEANVRSRARGHAQFHVIIASHAEIGAFRGCSSVESGAGGPAWFRIAKQSVESDGEWHRDCEPADREGAIQRPGIS